MKSIGLSLASIAATILAIGFNLPAVVLSADPGWRGILVTAVYLLVWAACTALLRKNRKFLLCGAVMGTLTCATALLLTGVNAASATLPAAFPLVAVFLTPLYGLYGLCGENLWIWLAAAAALGIGWTAAGLLLFRRAKISGIHR